MTGVLFADGAILAEAGCARGQAVTAGSAAG